MNTEKIKESIRLLRDKWVNSLPELDDLVVGLYPDSYLKQIQSTSHYKSLKAAFFHNKKVQATRLITKNLSFFMQDDNFVESIKIKEVWLFALKNRAIKVMSPIYNTIIFNEKLYEFIEKHERKFQCKLISKSDIKKIIPHVSLSKLFKEGRLRGALFDYKVQKWFFSKEDAERILTEEYEHIKKYETIAHDKDHERMVECNIDYIKRYVWQWLYDEGYYISICDEEFNRSLISEISNISSLKRLINSALLKDNHVGVIEIIDNYLSCWFTEKMQTDVNFSTNVKSELIKRELRHKEEAELHIN